MGTKMRVIRPGRVNKMAFRSAYTQELYRIGGEMVDDLKQTTVTWKEQPDFEFEVEVKSVLKVFAGLEVTAGVAAGGEASPEAIWAMLNEGTKPHTIRPVKAKVLRFRTGYVAKTIPMVLGSRSGGAKGDVVFAKEVKHPGTEARAWDKALKRKWERPFRERMSDAMREGAKRSGHKM